MMSGLDTESTDLTIRPAETADLPAIVRLLAEREELLCELEEAYEELVGLLMNSGVERVVTFRELRRRLSSNTMSRANRRDRS